MHYLRINGRGNAWPLQIQKKHPMYTENGVNDYANASFSICKAKNNTYQANELEWEVLIDAGHGIIPFILNHHNRIPEAIVLTHAHFDHILSVDWIVQSYFRQKKKKYPIYASEPCREAFSIVLHHLDGLIDWRILKVGKNTEISEAEGLMVTSYPVYHGYSAKGASMLMFSQKESIKKLLLTGDILCPLLAKKDIEGFQNIELMLVDCNNRFPYPKSNHWSFSNHKTENSYLTEFLNDFELTSLLKPHYMSKSEKDYILDIMSENTDTYSLCWNILDFIKKTIPEKIGLVHYSGSEDEKYYKEEILDSNGLEQWAKKIAEESNISSAIKVPQTDELLNIFN